MVVPQASQADNYFLDGVVRLTCIRFKSAARDRGLTSLVTSIAFALTMPAIPVLAPDEAVLATIVVTRR